MKLTRRSLLACTAAGLALGAISPLAALAEEAAPAEGAEGAATASAEAAAQLLADIEGTYTPLFETYAEYPELWEEYSAEIVGEDAAAETAEMLLGSCMGELTGEEAVEAYAADPDSACFYCGFPEGVAAISIGADGTVSGADADGNEVFSHVYSYYCYGAEAGWYVYRTTDEDAGEYAYFCALPDTPASTYHIEFRIGGDLNELFEYYTGKYAYWMGSGIPADADEETIQNGIELFVTENLAGM